MSRAKSKPAEPAAESPAGQAADRLPLLMETIFAVGRMAVVAIALTVGVISLLSGCTPLTLAVRIGASVLLSGLLVWFLAWLVAQGGLDSVSRQLREAGQLAPGTHGTWEA